MKKASNPKHLFRRLPDVLSDLGRLPGRLLSLQRNGPVLPADVNKQLRDAMFAPENVVEDARYSKIVPNDYIVEVNEHNYSRHYRPIEAVVTQQWRDKLRAILTTKNNRQGRQEYRFGGPLQIRIRPVVDLPESEARVLCRINPEVKPSPETVQACLELLSGTRAWPLRADISVIGRYSPCDVCLDMPHVQQKRLVSGQHAYIRHENGRFHLFDGTPDGKPSTNGTFVNGRRISRAGYELKDGDKIILAALDPNRPDPNTPGTAALSFRIKCGPKGR